MFQHKVFQVFLSLGLIFANSIGLAPLEGPVPEYSGRLAQGEIRGNPQTGVAGISETTAQIMQREAAVLRSSFHAMPHFQVGRSKLLENSLSPAIAQWPSAPDPSRAVAPLAPQPLGISFTGATLADTGWLPPDTMGTVGPTQFIVAVNGRLRSFNKVTGVADGVLSTTLNNFFASVMTPPTANNFTFSPRIRYDRLTGRWFVTVIDIPGQTGALANRVLIAMSDAATITSGTVWAFFYFNPDASNFAYDPTLGIDANALYIGADMFSLSTGAFSYTSAFVVRKSSLAGGGPIVWTPFSDLTGGSTGAGPLTPQGVDNYDPAATEGYFIGVDNATFSTLMIRRISNPGGIPSISANLSLTVPTTRYPVTVPHLGNTGGTNGYLDALDDRLFAAHIRNGRLWTAHNINVDASGVASSTRGRDAVRWYEIQNLSAIPSLVQAGTLFDPATTNPQYRWIPSIMVSGQSHVAVGYSNAGAASYANAATAGRLAGDTLGTMQTPVAYTASTFAYNPTSDPGGAGGRRWGNYSYTSLDPCDDMSMWTIQEFTDATNSYGVRAVKLIAPPPATPSTASPTMVPQGSSSVTVTITGTVVNGSGFYDTPSNLTDACRLRLVAAATGGVTVNSVTYVSPTLVQLNLSTVGATPGLKSLTITNPDGQSLTGNGLIQVVPSVTYTLSTAIAGNGSGTISLNPPGGAYNYGTVVTVTATQNVSSTFTGWSGDLSGNVNPGSVTIDNNKFITATFTLVKATATITLSNLMQAYDGTPKSVTVTTAPPGLPVDVIYNGSSTAPVNAGTYTVTATVNDTNYQGIVTGTLIINQANTSTSLASSSNPLLVGQGVTFTATVTSSGGMPTGNVIFYDNNVAIGAQSVNANGAAVFATSVLAAGMHFITANYTGNSNYQASTSAIYSQEVSGHLIYLPLILHRWPPIPETPVLNSIFNSDGDGNYNVTWNSALLAETYTLQEDDNPGFFSPNTVYSGASLSWSAANKTTGNYYYRVRASNTWGDSGWSNTQPAVVVPHLPGMPVLNSIFNADGDGNYTVSWNAAMYAQTYTLQEDDNAAFSSPIVAYSGTGLSWSASNRPTGTYYYRVRASNTDGASGWSGTQSVIVLPPQPVRKIAFVSDRDGNYEIYTMNPDGSGVARLTNNAAIDEAPTWSPDGSHIAFCSDRDGDFEIYVMNANGSGLVQLTTNTTTDCFPEWSPDGTRIAFHATGTGGSNPDVFVMNADGSGRTQLTWTTAYENLPTWSPDGAQIAFASNRDVNFGLYVMNADGSNQHWISGNLPAFSTDSFPAWSPDGAHIAFDHDINDNPDYTKSEISIINPDGTGFTNLTNNPAKDTYPTWSPTGQLAFVSYRDGNAEIYVMNGDGSGVTRLTNNAAYDSQPAWYR